MYHLIFSQCMEAKMDLTEEEIQNLGQDINLAIANVNNVDQILDDTTNDLMA